ncbi:MAG TPA: GGDEF domain-containing protein [Bryobacteraceae bacterium]|nr:GGDEF domain-containing protein [Bryobacteraceae bacterium]
MISLRKHIDAYTEQAAQTPLTGYKDLLLAIARSASEATPYLGEELRQKLKALNESLGDAPQPSRVREVHAEADRELAAWGHRASGYLGEKAREVRELMIAVADAAASSTERDQRYAGRFKDLTGQLHSIAKLEDLTSVRRSLVESAAELKSCAEKMAVEGAAAISQLTAEVSAYRAKLEESERRETTDGLTGVLNRRGIEGRLEGRIALGKPFSVAMLDLNEFKKTNDQYGHAAGDDLLRQFSTELQTQFKPGGIVGRWGGDEFVVVLQGGIEEARPAMDRVRRWVFGSYSLTLPDKSIKVNVTAATGVAEWNGKETLVELLARADERMYGDKRTSREAA